ncbi:MAG: hydrogenase [Glaciimonas sp.]|nr:hydrogenase [Glaciimonas sp.]
MKPAEPLFILPAREIPQTGLQEFTRLCADRLDFGDRILTLFGRPDGGEDVIVSAVMEGVGGRLSVLRAKAKRGERFDSLTLRYPAVHMFERELWEQMDITPAGHPWLKPIRHEGARQQHMTDYPFFQVRGAEVHEVGVGPIHSSVIEPGHFRFMCLGEQVHHLEIQLGYQHRGVEQLLLRRNPLLLTSTVESIVGDSSIAYAWTFCAALEALSETEVSIEQDLVRGVALELERVAMHVGALGGMSGDIAFLQGGATYGRLRTAIINASMLICGSRFGRGWLRPGGVRFGLTDALRQGLLATLAAFARDFAQVNELMLSARSVQARLQNVGVLSTTAAREIGMVGLAARASGVAVDTRVSLPGRLHDAYPVSLVTEESGDCWARLRLRMREIDESVRWLTQILKKPALDLCATAPGVTKTLRPDMLCVSVREGSRGEVVHVIETKNDGSLLHYKVQDPSLQNWFGEALSVRNNEISDFPICNKSFDLSYCGNDL